MPNGFTVSPDGTLAAYPEAKGETNVIALSDTDSGASLDSYEVGSPNSSVTNIRWSRDGKNIYYLQRAGSGTVSVYQLNISDRNTVKIRDVEVERVIPEVGFAVSADTKNIVIASGEWRHDLVLINGLK